MYRREEQDPESCYETILNYFADGNLAASLYGIEYIGARHYGGRFKQLVDRRTVGDAYSVRDARFIAISAISGESRSIADTLGGKSSFIKSLITLKENLGDGTQRVSFRTNLGQFTNVDLRLILPITLYLIWDQLEVKLHRDEENHEVLQKKERLIEFVGELNNSRVNCDSFCQNFTQLLREIKMGTTNAGKTFKSIMDSSSALIRQREQFYTPQLDDVKEVSSSRESVEKRSKSRSRKARRKRGAASSLGNNPLYNMSEADFSAYLEREFGGVVPISDDEFSQWQLRIEAQAKEVGASASEGMGASV